MRGPAAALFGLLVLVAPVQGQPLAERPGTIVTPPAAQEPRPIGGGFLLSAVLPGAAQYRAGDGRWVPYVAVEVWGWLSYLQNRRNGADLAERYRDVAAQVARRISVGPRRDTTFEYYEAVSKYQASGAFDSDPDVDGVQPERARDTYNADIWELAQGLYLGGASPVPGTPAYEAALAYYRRRAIPDGYAWAWGVSNLEQQSYVRLIHESDEAYSTAKQYLGLIIANHVASTVDALVTARLRQLGATGLRLETVPVRDPGGAGMRLEPAIRITF